MSLISALDIASQGMSAERVRVDVASSNLANAETTRGPDGNPYARLEAVFHSVDRDDGGVGVEVLGISRDTAPPRRVFMPDHPDADASGFVQMPNVNSVTEIVNLMSAQRGYEANATAFETAKTLVQRALDIIR